MLSGWKPPAECSFKGQGSPRSAHFREFAASLTDTISDEGARQAMKEFRKVALTPDAIGRAIVYAIEQPADVDVNEIIVRPTAGAQ